MKKKLNINIISDRLAKEGYTQTSLAKKIGVSKEAVSQWLKNENLPRPDKLLLLGKLLKMKYDEMIIRIEEANDPRVSFRLKANKKLKNEDMATGRTIGKALEKLIKYFDIETLQTAPTLINPKNDYEYIVDVAIELRNQINPKNDKIVIQEIINIYKIYKATLIPVLWGEKQTHENAFHILLPETMTSWVYINIDTYKYDFKFWLLHELAHILTPNVNDNFDAELFADNLAGEILCPRKQTEKYYEKIFAHNNIQAREYELLQISEELEVSPYTIYKRINKYAHHNNLEVLNWGEQIGKIINNSRSVTIATELFGDGNVSIEKYIEICEKYFKTNIFSVLIEALEENDLNAEYFKTIFNISILEAKSIRDYLIGKKHKYSP